MTVDWWVIGVIAFGNFMVGYWFGKASQQVDNILRREEER